MLLTGRHDQTIDSKNRTVIPSEYRSAYNNTVILLPRPNGCISVYTVEMFGTMLSEMDKNAKTEEERQKVKNISSLGTTITFDGAGRFTVPEALIKHAGLENAIVVLGCFKTLEIWSKERYEQSNYVSIENITMADIPEGLL